MFKVAMLSKWHVHASDYAKQISEIPGCSIAYVWDEDPVRASAWAAELNVPYIADLDELLAKDDFDGVICDTPTTMHEAVLVKAANAKKHIFTEKVLATTAAGCDAIAEAVRGADVKFCISYPYRTQPMYIYAKQLVENGTLGDISLMRMRNGHDGALAGWLPPYWFDKAQTGGGALMDLGCHPIYILDWLFGRPRRVYASMTYQTGREVDDSAVLIADMPSGTIAVLETSLISPVSPGILEIYGTLGSLRCIGEQVEIRMQGEDDWHAPSVLPAPAPMPMQQWVDAIKQNGDVPFDLSAAKRLTVIMEAAYTSAQKGYVEYL